MRGRRLRRMGARVFEVSSGCELWMIDGDGIGYGWPGRAVVRCRFVMDMAVLGGAFHPMYQWAQGERDVNHKTLSDSFWMRLAADTQRLVPRLPLFMMLSTGKTWSTLVAVPASLRSGIWAGYTIKHVTCASGGVKGPAAPKRLGILWRLENKTAKAEDAREQATARE